MVGPACLAERVKRAAKGGAACEVLIGGSAGLRQVRPGGRLFPAWFDIYPNSERIQQVEGTSVHTPCESPAAAASLWCPLLHLIQP